VRSGRKVKEDDGPGKIGEVTKEGCRLKSCGNGYQGEDGTTPESTRWGRGMRRERVADKWARDRRKGADSLSYHKKREKGHSFPNKRGEATRGKRLPTEK